MAKSAFGRWETVRSTPFGMGWLHIVAWRARGEALQYARLVHEAGPSVGVPSFPVTLCGGQPGSWRLVNEVFNDVVFFERILSERKESARRKGDVELMEEVGMEEIQYLRFSSKITTFSSKEEFTHMHRSALKSERKRGCFRDVNENGWSQEFRCFPLERFEDAFQLCTYYFSELHELRNCASGERPELIAEHLRNVPRAEVFVEICEERHITLCLPHGKSVVIEQKREVFQNKSGALYYPWIAWVTLPVTT